MKNEYRIQGNITLIYLNPSRTRTDTPPYFIIDTADLEDVKSIQGVWTSNYMPSIGKFYIVRSYKEDGKSKREYLHRRIMNPGKGLVVDHINHDPLDNRRENLRSVTTAMNSQNKAGASKTNKSTGVRGVRQRGSRFVACMNIGQKYIHIGTFDTVHEAEEATVKARLLHFPGYIAPQGYEYLQEAFERELLEQYLQIPNSIHLFLQQNPSIRRQFA